MNLHKDVSSVRLLYSMPFAKLFVITQRLQIPLRNYTAASSNSWHEKEAR